MRSQIIKHNKRYLKGIPLLKSAFGEQATGLIIVKLIEGLTPIENELIEYDSLVHKTYIDMNDFYKFLKQHAPCNEVLSIRSTSAYTCLQHSYRTKQLLDTKDCFYVCFMCFEFYRK